MSVLYNKKKNIPGVYKNPLNYDNIKIYIVVPGDPYDASIYGVFQDKRKAELYAEIHDLVVVELETMDEEAVVFGWKVSVIFMNNPKKATIYISKCEIEPFCCNNETRVETFSAYPYRHPNLVLYITRYILDQYATEEQLRSTYKKAALDIMAYCEERASSGYKTSQINEFLKSKVERGYFK